VITAGAGSEKKHGIPVLSRKLETSSPPRKKSSSKKKQKAASPLLRGPAALPLRKASTPLVTLTTGSGKTPRNQKRKVKIASWSTTGWP